MKIYPIFLMKQDHFFLYMQFSQINKIVFLTNAAARVTCTLGSRTISNQTAIFLLFS